MLEKITHQCRKGDEIFISSWRCAKWAVKKWQSKFQFYFSSWWIKQEIVEFLIGNVD